MEKVKESDVAGITAGVVGPVTWTTRRRVTRLRRRGVTPHLTGFASCFSDTHDNTLLENHSLYFLEDKLQQDWCLILSFFSKPKTSSGKWDWVKSLSSARQQGGLLTQRRETKTAFLKLSNLERRLVSGEDLASIDFKVFWAKSFFTQSVRNLRVCIIFEKFFISTAIKSKVMRSQLSVNWCQ